METVDSSHLHLAGDAPSSAEIATASAKIEVLRSLLASATGDQETAQLTFEIGSLLAHPLRDIAAALEACRAAWRLQPDAPHIVRAYHRAARRAESWDDLLAALESEARIEGPGPQRAALLAEQAEILETRFKNRKAAAAAYHAALEAHASHVPALTALERMALEDGEPSQAGTYADRLAQGCTAADLRAEFEVRAATHLHRGNEVTRALTLANQAQVRAPRSWVVQLRLEMLLARQGLWADLAALRQTQIEQGDVDPAEGWFDVGLLARYRLDNPKLAIQAFTQAVKVAEPGCRAAIFSELVPLLEKAGQWEALPDLLLEWVQLETEPARRAELHYRLGRVCEDKQGDLERAAESYDRALDEDRAYLPALEGAGRAYQRLGRHDRLLRMHQLELEAAKSPRQRAESLRRCAQVLLRRPEAADEATALLQEARSLAPQNLACFLALESIFTARGAWEDLASLYQQELEQTDDPGRKGWLLIAVGVISADRLADRRRAIAAFREAGQLPESGHQYVLERLARLLEDDDEPESLIEVLRQLAAMTQHPSLVASVHERLAGVQERLGRTDDAIASFREALEVAPPTHPVFASAGRLFLRCERYSEIVQMHERAAEGAAPPEKVVLLIKAAEVLAHFLGDAAGAVARLRQAVAIDPDHPLATARLCQHLRLEEHWEELRALLARQGGDKGRLALLRAPLAEAGDDDAEAAALYREAVASGLRIATLAHVRMLLRIESGPALLAHYQLTPDSTLARRRAALLTYDQTDAQPDAQPDDDDAAALLELAAADPQDLPTLVLAWPRLFSDSSLAEQMLPRLAEQLNDPLLRGAAQERLLAALLRGGALEEALQLRGRLLASGQRNPVLTVQLEVLCEARFAREPLARLCKELADDSSNEPTRRAAAAFTAGLLLEEIGSHQEAVSAVEAAVAHAPQGGWISALLFLIHLHTRDGDDARAGQRLRDLATALPPSPERAACLRRLGQRLAAQGKAAEAASVLGEALAAEPQDLQTLRLLETQLADNSLPLIGHLQRAFEAEQEPDVAVKLGTALALRLFREGRKLPTRAVVRRVLAMAPASFDAQTLWADLVLASARWAEAVELLRRLAEHPAAPPLLRAEVLARLVAIPLLHLDDVQAARRAADELRRCVADPRALPLQLALATLLGDEPAMLEALVALVADASRTEEERSEYRFRLAELQAEHQGDCPAAIATLGGVRAALFRAEAVAEILELAQRSGRWTLAASAIDETLASEPPADPAWEVAVRLQLGERLEKEWPEPAIRQYERALGLDPNHLAVLERLADLTTRDHPHAAIDHNRSLLERSPDRLAAYRTLRKLFLAVAEQDSAFLCEAVLEGLGAADEEERYFYRQRRANLGKQVEGNLEPTERAILLPEQGHPAVAVLAALDGVIHRVLMVDMDEYGFLGQTEVPAAVQQTADSLAAFLGCPPFRILVSSANRPPTVEPGAPAALILPRRSLDAPRRELAFTLGEMLAWVAFQVACADPRRATPLTGPLLEQLLWAAAQLIAGPLECPFRGRPIFEDLLRRLETCSQDSPDMMSPLRPEVDRLLPLLGTLSGDEILAALERAALRSGLLCAQDPAVALATMRCWADPGAAGRALPAETLRAVTFTVSPAHLELRRRRNLGVCS